MKSSVDLTSAFNSEEYQKIYDYYHLIGAAYQRSLLDPVPHPLP